MFVLCNMLIVFIFYCLIVIENESEDPLFWLNLRRRGFIFFEVLVFGVKSCESNRSDTAVVVVVVVVVLAVVFVMECLSDYIRLRKD